MLHNSFLTPRGVPFINVAVNLKTAKSVVGGHRMRLAAQLSGTLRGQSQKAIIDIEILVRILLRKRNQLFQGQCLHGFAPQTASRAVSLFSWMP